MLQRHPGRRWKTVGRGALLGLSLWMTPWSQAGALQAVDSAVGAALDDFARELAAEVDSTGLGGLGAAVMVEGEIVWEEGFGWADAEAGRPVTPETVFRTGSISKTFTAAALMTLVDAGVVALDEPVATHFPEIEELRGYADHGPVTFRQLASHTAGLEREPGLEGAAEGPLEEWEEKVLASIPTTGFLGPVGAAYSYSNIGYGILGLALSGAAGRGFMELVRTSILEPAGMAASGFTPSPEVAVGYGNWDPEAEVNTELPAAEHAGRGYKVPNGGLYASAGDLLRFGRELTVASRGGVLSEEARREMLTVQTPLRIETVYGLGLFLTPGRVRGATEILAWHDGAVAGYSAMLALHPSSGTGVAWMRGYNRGPSDMDAIVERLLTRLLPP